MNKMRPFLVYIHLDYESVKISVPGFNN